MITSEQGVSLRTILHSLETTVPKIVLQRVEELYPGVMESMVSVQKMILSSCSLCIYMAIETEFVIRLW
jgi:hypothetical protein